MSSQFVFRKGGLIPLDVVLMNTDPDDPKKTQRLNIEIKRPSNQEVSDLMRRIKTKTPTEDGDYDDVDESIFVEVCNTYLKRINNFVVKDFDIIDEFGNPLIRNVDPVSAVKEIKDDHLTCFGIGQAIIAFFFQSPNSSKGKVS